MSLLIPRRQVIWRFVIIRKTAQLKGDTGPTFSEVGGLFEGVGELQDAEVLLVAAYDLQSDGQALG